MEGTPPRDLPPVLHDEVYRIVGEALRNAFRHAQARQVEVEIQYDDRQFRLRVRDNGKGIDPGFSVETGAPDITACMACANAPNLRAAS